MLKKKKTLACPVKKLFSNILTESVGQQQNGETATTEASGDDGDDSAASVPTVGEDAPEEVTQAFRKYVSDSLAKRLANDPDFDPEKHPSARDAFGDKRKQ